MCKDAFSRGFGILQFIIAAQHNRHIITIFRRRGVMQITHCLH